MGSAAVSDCDTVFPGHTHLCFHCNKIVSEYDQEIPQSQTKITKVYY